MIRTCELHKKDEAAAADVRQSRFLAERKCADFPHHKGRTPCLPQPPSPLLPKKTNCTGWPCAWFPASERARRASSRAFQLAQAIFRASRSELEARGLSGSIAQTIASGCTFDDAVDQQQKMLETGAAPDRRSPIPPTRRACGKSSTRPIVLFARGRIELLQSIMLGVVGTRRPTAYGIAATERLSADLAQAGLTIASGMARGIDTAAHRAALDVGGDTVAVFGCGVDLVYPAENRKLAAEIAEKGLLISEFPMGSPAYPQNFPIRNRIISGMSVGRAGGGRRAVQRIGHYGQDGARPAARGFRGARQHHCRK